MRSVVALFLLAAIIVMAGAQENDSESLTVMLKTGTSVGISGYTIRSRGYDEETPEEFEETEYMPGFLLNSLQLGVGGFPLPRLYAALVPGVWFSEDFSRFAFTPASLFLQYALTENSIAPVVRAQGGIFIEQPISAFGFFLNPAVGVVFQTGAGSRWFIDIGYLFTSWTLEDDFVDTTDRLYVNLDEDMRHSISVCAGYVF